MGIKDTITLEQLATTLDEFKKLYDNYQTYFIKFDPGTHQSFQANEIDSYKKVWQGLFNFFIPSLDLKKTPEKNVNILISLYPVKDKNYVFDMASIFDLQFRFLPLEKNIDYYALSVAGLGLVDFCEKLINLFKPIAARTIILYGFDKHYSLKGLQGASAFIRTLAIARQSLYNTLLGNAKLAGAQVIDLHSNSDLLDCFKKGKEGYLIQILTHYNHNPDYKKSRLLFKTSSIRFDILEKLIDEMKLKDELRKDIIIDAVTCTNFFDLKTLYSKGIRYMYLSHHDFDTDQAAFVLNELYTGINARRINWNYPYLNGNDHFHEARSNVYRCFFFISRTGHSILTP